MRPHEHIAVSAASRYFTDALILNRPKSRTKQLSAWKALDTALRQSSIDNPDVALADAVSRTIEARWENRPKRRFKRAFVFVGHQGSGKDYIADHMGRLGYERITMSDIVKAVAPALGFSPDTTQGKIDAGHAMRKLFGKRIFTDLGFSDARRNGVTRVIMTGPRSSREIYAARDFGAKIISLVADVDRKKDRAIRLKRVTAEERTTADGTPRVMTEDDFKKREKQEYRRITRLMKLADTVITNNTSPEQVIRTITKATG